MKEPQRSSLTQLQLGVWPLKGVCHALHSHPSCNEQQNSKRSDGVPPYLMVACVEVPVRKLQERLPIAWVYLIKLFSLPCVCACIGVCALRFPPRAPPTRNRFRSLWRLWRWRPLRLPSIHLCSGPKPLEFVKRGGGTCSNRHRHHWDYRLTR